MPEGEHSVSAPGVSEQKTPPEEHAVWEELIEIIEVTVLALVAFATAWSGYQAAKWNGQQSLLYGTASAYRFQADAAATATDQPSESSRFQNANRYGGIFAVPETMAGVTNTARKPHRA